MIALTTGQQPSSLPFPCRLRDFRPCQLAVRFVCNDPNSRPRSRRMLARLIEAPMSGNELRSSWVNCALTTDPEIEAIDRMEDTLGVVPEGARHVRALISTFELCHHDAAHRIDNILDAIDALDTDKGFGTRPVGRAHPAEQVWREAMARVDARAVNADPLRRWQLERVVEKIRSVLDPTQTYTWLLLRDDGTYRDTCPEAHLSDQEHWLETVKTMLHDPEELSLALAIDMLWPCHWRFKENLQIVLDAIDGELRPKEPFTACGRNIEMTPLRERVERTCERLQKLGRPGSVQQWLAASLDKTLRLQLSPPEDVRTISALRTPEVAFGERTRDEGRWMNRLQ